MNLFTDLPIIENVLIAPVHPRKEFGRYNAKEDRFIASK